MSTLLTRLAVEVKIGSSWIDLGDDLLDELTFRYGIEGSLPIDCVASPGELTFTLDNSETNSVETLGYYSPLHVNALAGWGFGLPVRVVMNAGAGDVEMFRGRVRTIDPEPGEYAGRRVTVTAFDGIFDLLDADVGSLTIAEGQTESQLVAAVLAAAPAGSQPVAQSLDTGVDVIPIAFSELGDNPKALAIINALCVSSGAMAHIRGDGTFVLTNRHNRATAVSAMTLTDEDMASVDTPSSIEHCWNRVHVTVPRVHVADAPSVFFDTDTRGTLDIPKIEFGETKSIWISYFSAEEPEKVGALDVVIDSYSTPYLSMDFIPVDAFDVVGTFFSSTARIDVTYARQSIQLEYPVPVTMELSGRVVTSLGDQVFKANVLQSYDRLFPVRMQYDPGAEVAEGMAVSLASQFAAIQDQAVSLTFNAERTPTLLTAALARGVGDRITLQETVTGVSTDAIIHSIEITIRPGGAHGGPVTVTWGLAPAAPWAIWSLGDDGFSELDETTILGF